MENIRVEVYWNLHKRLFSVRALEGENKGRVIKHTYGVQLKDATFAVQPAGRERVRREGVKNVHAFVRGRLTGTSYGGGEYDVVDAAVMPKITYNPYKYDSFVNAHTKEPIYKAKNVYLDAMLGKGLPFPRILIGRHPFLDS